MVAFVREGLDETGFCFTKTVLEDGMGVGGDSETGGFIIGLLDSFIVPLLVFFLRPLTKGLLVLGQSRSLHLPFSSSLIQR